MNCSQVIIKELVMSKKSKNADISLMILKLEQFRKDLTSFLLLKQQRDRQDR